MEMGGRMGKTREPERKVAGMNIREITNPQDFDAWAQRVNEAYGSEHLR